MIGSLAAALVGLGAKHVYDYAAPPLQPKHCIFTYPEQITEYNGTAIRVRFPSHIPLSQTGGTINDASCLNKTPVYAIVEIRKEEDIRNALFFAKEHDLKVSVAGQQH